MRSENVSMEELDRKDVDFFSAGSTIIGIKVNE